MTSHQPDNSKQICEQILLDEKRYNISKHILPSETVIVDRLLGRGLELKNAYQELHGKLAHRPGALQTFLGQVLTTAAFWNPEKIREARTARNDLEETNRKIATKAAELANLLQRRENLHNTSGFTSDTHYHVCDVLKAAGRDNHLFTSRVQKRFEELHNQFDLKYWPTLSDFLHELGSDADEAAPQASDPLTEVATSALRSSLADFFKALFVAITENSARNYGQLPNDLRLTDATLATIVNCALDLGPDELVDSIYVKGLRQRERGRTE
ncbi:MULTISPECIES: hypothetical protein [unclassified Duganella]|uniref:hypothetical protein n=1 Tax=unclassified Duganella TaxID=2636909 RepID=UPI0008869AF5|nr:MULTISPECIES: hypothetical protein [unclassified Duganella]SDG81870.1 hypothetical protein SAMN05216320_107179 [Duganella sp. OV458]SDK09304.1 hypothetical protein SAMN05428973_108179 [Duganella sp. OV510]